MSTTQVEILVKVVATTMINRRKQLISAVAKDISEMKRAISVNETSISNFQTRGSGDAEYNAIRIENGLKNIEELRSQISLAEHKIVRIDEGLLDGEIQNEVQRNKEFTTQRVEKAKLIAESDNACKEIGKMRSKAFFEIERSAKYSEKTVGKELNKYWDALETLPPNILKNIETTPCNRCYRYRGVCFYGKRPEQKPDMVFQKTHDGTLIEELTDEYITTYLKPFNGANKTLVSKYRRETTPNLSGPAKLTRIA